MQDDAPSDDDDPAGQIEHFNAVEVLLYVPSLQLAQYSDPMYCPDEHEVHLLDPGSDDDPRGHVKHSVNPFSGPYVPAGQIRHEDPPTGE